MAKRKTVTLTPKKQPKRRLSCLVLLFVVCGVIFVATPRSRAPRVAATPTSVAAAATNTVAAATATTIQALLAASITPSATITDTPTPTQALPTAMPSATITDTPAPTQALPTATPSATITDTPTPTQALPTAMPAPTSAPAETWYTVSAANLRSCASTSCDQVARLSTGAAISIIGFEQGETYQSSDIWRKVDYNGQVVYVHSSLVAAIAPRPTVVPVAPVQIVQPTSVPVQPVQPPSNPGLVCPRNCDEARALGWTAEQAGQCDNLDRDDDDVACYGD